MSRYQTRARLAAERRDDARAETLLRLGPNVHAYDGSTPRMIDGRSPFEARQVGWNTRERRGTVEAVRGGGRKFKPWRADAASPARAPAKSYGEAIGDALVGDKLVSVALVNRPASMPRAT